MSNGNEQGKIISFINMKGGVAKTTLSKELGIYFAEQKQSKVLLIDLDPQANLTQSLFEVYNIIDTSEIDTVEKMEDEVNKLPSINNLYDNTKTEEPDLPSLIQNLRPNLDLIPGSLNSIFYGKNTNGDYEQALHNLIKRKKLRNNYKYIIIDCPPTYSSYTVSAILASDFYVIPVKPDAYSALGIDLLEKVITKIKGTYDDTFSLKPIHNLGIIFTKYDKMAKRETDIKNDIQSAQPFDNMYKFSESFPKQDGLATQKLDYVITHKDNSVLNASIKAIGNELIKEVEKYEE